MSVSAATTSVAVTAARVARSAHCHQCMRRLPRGRRTGEGFRRREDGWLIGRTVRAVDSCRLCSSSWVVPAVSGVGCHLIRWLTPRINQGGCRRMDGGEVMLASPGAFRLVLPGPRRGGLLQQRVEQLVRDSIADGVLVEGDRLPPYRVAAVTSRVSIHTILNAYRALNVEGAVRSVPGDGYFIAGPVRYSDFFALPDDGPSV